VANKRLLAAQQTRANLIETGLVLAEELGLEGLSVNAVVAGAGVSKGTFFHHFPDRVAVPRGAASPLPRCAVRRGDVGHR
jgi:AcrR family transcriptional regulator